MHWKKLMDPKEFLFAHDLEGRDVTVEFTNVIGGELEGEKGRKTKKPIAMIKVKPGNPPKKLALNATNCKTIQQLTGSDQVEDWAGVRVTLFPTTTQFGGETKDCIRIRPYHPRDGKGSKGGGKPDLTQAIAEKMADDAEGASAERSTNAEPDAEEQRLIAEAEGKANRG
jgi:hypothetical protein